MSSMERMPLKTTVPRAGVWLGTAEIVVAAAIMLIALVIVWLAPATVGDLFVTLAGGRDVLAGRLGAADAWSFTTHGRVWLNENWGAGAVFYLLFQALGYGGLLGLKAVLIIVGALFSVLAVRKRGAPSVIALTVVAVGLVLARNYFILRANLFTLALAPLLLWLLYQAAEKPRLVWFSIPLLIVWANLHGGFIFGAGMMALWALAQSMPDLIAKGPQGLRRHWPLYAAGFAAVLGAGLLNPFGLKTLTMPFAMMQKTIWSNIHEWQPLWVSDLFLDWRIFLLAAGLPVLLLAIRLTAGRQRGKEPGERDSLWYRPGVGTALFEAALFITVVAMGLRSMRFASLALLMILPIIAVQIRWVVGQFRRRWLLIVLELTVALVLVGPLRMYTLAYHTDNPFAAKGSLFEKMHRTRDVFPVNLAKFFNDNRIAGNVFCKWPWEGYLRWYCPRVKVFVGGRAQQVYDEQVYGDYLRIISGENPAAIMDRYPVAMVAYPADTDEEKLVTRAVQSGAWVAVYADGKDYLLVKADTRLFQKLSKALLAGELVYGDPLTAAMSKVEYLASTKTGELDQAVEQLFSALVAQPTVSGYALLKRILFVEPELAQCMEAALLRELARLESGAALPDPVESLGCRLVLVKILSNWYRQANKPEAVGRMDLIARRLAGELDRLWTNSW